MLAAVDGRKVVGLFVEAFHASNLQMRWDEAELGSSFRDEARISNVRCSFEMLDAQWSVVNGQWRGWEKFSVSSPAPPRCMHTGRTVGAFVSTFQGRLIALPYRLIWSAAAAEVYF